MTAIRLPGFESPNDPTQAGFERAKLIVNLHAQRLENLRRGMTSSVTADDFFDRFRERERFAKRRFLAHFHDLAGDAARGWFFAVFAENAGQFFLAVAVDDFRGRQFATRIHPHIERAVAHKTETAISIFKLARGNAEIEERAADLRNPQLVEHLVGVAKVGAAQGDAAAEGR